MPISNNPPRTTGLMGLSSLAHVDTQLKLTISALRLKASDTVALLDHRSHMGSPEVVKNLRDIQTGLHQLRQQVSSAPGELRTKYERAIDKLVSQYQSKFPDGVWQAAFSKTSAAKTTVLSMQDLVSLSSTRVAKETPASRPLPARPSVSSGKEAPAERFNAALEALSQLRTLSNPDGKFSSFRNIAGVGELSMLNSVQREFGRVIRAIEFEPPHESARLMSALQSIKEEFGPRYPDAQWQQAFSSHLPLDAAPRAAAAQTTKDAHAANSQKNETLSQTKPTKKQPPPVPPRTSAKKAAQAQAVKDKELVADTSSIGKFDATHIAFDFLEPDVASMQGAARDMVRAFVPNSRLDSASLHANIDQFIASMTKEPEGMRRSSMNAALALMESFRSQKSDASWQRAFSYRQDDMRALAGQKNASPAPQFLSLCPELRAIEKGLQYVAFPPREATEARPGMIPIVRTQAFRTNNMEAFRKEVDKAIQVRQDSTARRAQAGQTKPEQDQQFGASLLAMLKSFSNHLSDPEWQSVLSYRLGDIAALANAGR